MFLLWTRKLSTKSILSKKKHPAVLTQESTKSTFNPYHSNKSVAILPSKKLTKQADSNSSEDEDTEDNCTSSDEKLKLSKNKDKKQVV